MPVNTRYRNKISDEAARKSESADVHTSTCNESPDLFSSQQSAGISQRSCEEDGNPRERHQIRSSQRSEVIDQEVLQQLEREIWVQCDNTSCQKWRRVTTEVVEEGKWFCFMNSDLHHNNCDAEEENYIAYDKLARKIGLKYVFSCLPEGALVWAKMVGYCRWPALITKDPSCGTSMDTDKDGDPLFYHVEYLGDPHSHGWVRSHFVVAYGHKAEGERLSGNDSNSHIHVHVDKGKVLIQKRKGSKKRAKALAQVNQKPVRQRYKRQTVDSAIEEADKMLDLVEEERLEKAVFKWVPELEEEPHCSKSDAVFEFEDPGRNPKSLSITTKQHLKSTNNPLELDSNTGDRDTVILEEDIICFHRTKKLQKSKLARETVSTHSRIRADVGQGKITPPDNPFCAFNFSLVNKSKEEKLVFDVQMYAKNEKAFEHDVRRFLDRHGMQIRHLPTWQNITISLFQLFMAVHDQGGYHEVCRRRGWAKIYREMTNHPTSSTGNLAKAYYFRNLLPYELYLRGEEYDHLIKESASGAKRRKTRTDDQGADITTCSRESAALSECSEDLQTLWADLEQSSHFFELDQVNEDQDSEEHVPGNAACPAPVKRFGLDVLFYDESPDNVFSPGVRLADTASEFGHAELPEDCARLIPRSNMSSDDEHTEDDDTDMDILEDLQNVQQQIDALNNHLFVEE